MAGRRANDLDDLDDLIFASSVSRPPKGSTASWVRASARRKSISHAVDHDQPRPAYYDGPSLTPRCAGDIPTAPPRLTPACMHKVFSEAWHWHDRTTPLALIT